MDTRKLSIILFNQTCRTQYEKDSLQLMLPGFLASGDIARVSNQRYEKCDVAVIMYSPRSGAAPSTRASRFIRNLHPKNLLIIEMPLFRDTQDWYYRFGFDHVHDGGRFISFAAGRERIKQLGLEVRPWKTDGNAIVIASQLQGDYSLDGIDIDEWAADVANFVSCHYDRDIVIRRHPLSYNGRCATYDVPNSVEISDAPLKRDLARAWRWVTFTSGSSIDAVLAGVPSVTLSQKNFSWSVSSHDLTNLASPATPDRTDWLARLASHQWNLDEIASGEAWGHLRQLVL